MSLSKLQFSEFPLEKMYLLRNHMASLIRYFNLAWFDINRNGCTEMTPQREVSVVIVSMHLNSKSFDLLMLMLPILLLVFKIGRMLPFLFKIMRLLLATR